MAYVVPIETSGPAKIIANGQDMGDAPLNIKIFGDPDGTFHDFGSYYYVVQAIPASTNQFSQTKVFRTGHLMTPEDRIPSKIYFDMSRPQPPPTYYYGPPPAYPYGYPYGYGPGYYGPGVQFYFGPGPGYYHRHW